MKNKKISIILSFVITLISIFIIQHPASVYADSNGLCVQFKYTHGTMGNQYAWSSSEGKSNAVCSKTGKAEKDDLFIEGSDDIVSFSLEGDTLKMKISTLGTEVTDSRACGGGQCPTERTYDTKEYSLGQYSSFDALSNAIIEDYSAHFPIEKKSNSTPVMVTEKIIIPDDFTIKYGDINITTPNNLTAEYGDENDSDDDDEEEVTCMNSGGAESLGWIVCPLLTWMQSAAEGAYNNYVKPNLEVQPALFQGSNNATQNAWSTFQGLANSCFAILLLVIIFSQLTGVGIDNYGIKKILPKLIVVAVLVNLSYLICLICVDLSNILGNALQALFEGMSPDVSGVTITDSDNAKTIGTTTITAVALLGLLFAVGAAVWQNPAILLTLLVAALGVLISIFFLFILLAARKAAIVVLTVISPVAFVCYMLPNTKKLFDKWLNFWEALLLLYPICGMLIGGGDFVSKLMLAAGSNTESDFFTAFTAMIVGIIPVFFIPTVLKSSFAALGSIGSKITGFGDRMRNGATGKLRNSEKYKNAQKRGLERRTRVMAGLNSKGNPTRLGAAKARLANTKFGRAVGYQSSQAARVAAANKTREENIQNAAELSDVNLKYQKSQNPSLDTRALLTRQLEAARDRGDTNGMFAVIEQAKKSNMQASAIADMTRTTLGGRNLGNMSDGERKNFLEEFGKKYSGDFLKKDYEQADWARKGGVGVNGAAGVTGWATATGTDASGKVTYNIAIDDLKDEDVASLSSSRLQELIDAGKISSAQAQRVWASNGSMDDTSRLMLGTFANTGTSVSKEDAQKALQGSFEGTASGLSAERVTAYTRRSPQATVIEDVRVRNVEDGSNRLSDTLYVHDSGKGQNPPPNPPTETFEGGAGI